MTRAGRNAKMTSSTIETGQVWTRTQIRRHRLKGDTHITTLVKVLGVQVDEQGNVLVVHANVKRPKIIRYSDLEEFVNAFQRSHLGLQHPKADWVDEDTAALTFEGEPTGYRGRGRPPKALGHRPPVPPRKKEK